MNAAEGITAELPAGRDALALGRYRLGRRLGSGGFGTVFEARDERLGRLVAVKVLAAAGPDPERVRREALAAARLHHPAVVAVYDAGEDADGRYLVSELVRGRTLAALEAEGALGDRDVLRVGLALAGGLAHAHERGVVHRDVKPQNVIVPDQPADPRGAAKLTDFGVAHLAGDEPLTLTGDVVGTLAYMAPEQAAGERVDDRADVYALALVLYEALAGANPVRGPGPAATARRVGTVLPPLAGARPGLPRALCAALDRALAPDPDDRGELGDLADALAAALPEVPDDGPPLVVPHPLERRHRRLPRAAGRLAAGVAAGVLLAAALTAAGDPGWAFGAGGVAAAGGSAAVVVAILPRIGWLIAAAAALAALAAARPEAAALAAAGVAASPLLLLRRGTLWSVPAAAPALGLAGVAPAFPGLAAGVRGPLARAALGAAGLWWLLVAEEGLDRPLLLGPDPGPGALLLAPLWALAALLAPYLVPGRALVVDLAGAAAWAAGGAAATAAVAERAGLPEPRGLAAGAVAAGVAAVLARRMNPRARDTVSAGHDPRAPG